MLISGIVGSQHTHLDKVASQVPDGAKPASRTKRFARWIANDGLTASLYYVPFAELVLASETFFSDQKSRGFHIHKSHISDPKRLTRLLIAACLAYLWVVYLGTLAHVEGWVAIIHRTERCDLSLFQLGLRLLEHFLNEGMPIPVAFTVLLFADEEHAWMEWIQ